MLFWVVFVVGALGEPSCPSSSIEEPNWRESKVLSWDPRVVYFPNFLSEEEIEAVLDAAKPHLEQAKTDTGIKTDIRNSFSAFLSPHQEKGAIMTLKQKAADVTHIPLVHFEALQVQRYRDASLAERGEEFYRPHMDSMDGHRPSRRVATWIFYLSDVESGGETVFPLTLHNGPERERREFNKDYRKAIEFAGTKWPEICAPNSPAIRVTPKRGAALLFYSLTPLGELDLLTVHGGCPVKKGVKWISQQWIHESPYALIYDSNLIASYSFKTIQKKIGGLPGKPSGPLLPTKPSELFQMDTVVRLGHEFEVCTAPGPVLSSINTTRAFSLFAEIFVQTCERGRENLAVRLIVSGAGPCCSFSLSVSKGCGVAVYGPDKYQRKAILTQRLQTGWNHVGVVVQTADNPVAPVDPSKWTYEMHLTVNSETVTAPVNEFPLTDDVSWDNTQICVVKGSSMGVRQIYLFNKVLKAADYAWFKEAVAVERTRSEVSTHSLPLI
eukprot:c19378_g1_i3.p1 GENE.c19378_g1_i3~~c19378_g1_i3.p1  ORF type:complete len:497 (-),score=97.64 c19378_g1_i3:98-1588(-)